MAVHELQDLSGEDVWWTPERAALHLGCPRSSILRYIREGLPVRHGLINRNELLAEFRARKMRQVESRMTRRKE